MYNYDVIGFGNLEEFNNTDFFIIGKSKADHIIVRPRIGQYVIMVESKENNEKFWFHYVD
jgi:hypothetical protein